MDNADIASVAVAVLSLLVSLWTLRLQRRDRRMRGREVRVRLSASRRSPGTLQLTVRNTSPEPIRIISWRASEYPTFWAWWLASSSGDSSAPGPGRKALPKRGDWRTDLTPPATGCAPQLPIVLEAFDHATLTWPPEAESRCAQAGIELALGDRFFTEPVFLRSRWWDRLLAAFVFSAPVLDLGARASRTDDVGSRRIRAH